jgi:invasion protein IalB
VGHRFCRPDTNRSLDPGLQTVVDLAYSRLRQTRCLWSGCTATLNSVDNLVKHLKIHADETEVRVCDIR